MSAGVILTRKLSNGHEVRSHQFDDATVHVKGPFVVVHHSEKESGESREDWFAVGYVLRVEIMNDDDRD